MLEKSSDWAILHDATTHYVKNLNTVFVRGVRDNDMSIAKVTRHQSLNFVQQVSTAAIFLTFLEFYCHLF